jgi:hypothetical protein
MITEKEITDIALSIFSSQTAIDTGRTSAFAHRQDTIHAD